MIQDLNGASRMINFKKSFLITILVFFTQLVGAEQYAESNVDMQVQKVGKYTYYVQGQAGTATENEGFISNAGFIITDGGVVIFDALGTPSLANKLLKKIREITNKPIKKVIASHYHADHIYGLQVFKKEGAQIFAPKGAEDYLNSENSENLLETRRLSLDPWVNDNTFLVKPDKYINKNMDFTEGNIQFSIIYLGKAHSDGDLALIVKDDKALFSGDIIFEGRVPFVGDADTKLWLEKLKSLETNGINVLIPGHGPHASEPTKAIAMTREYIEELRTVFRTAVDDFIDFSEAFDNYNWDKWKNLPAYELAHRRNAYTVFLAVEKEMMNEDN